MSAPLLEVRRLTAGFPGPGGAFAPAVDGLSFSLEAGETLALVGESGCGKSVTALSLLGLIPPPGRVTGGQILYGGRDLLTLRGPQLQAVRGAELAMIFQDPVSALNPALPIGRQVAQSFIFRQGYTPAAARRAALDLLSQVGLPDPKAAAASFPHQLSGGMCQRVMIAMALACRPRVLIADEPTTSLDVTVQAQILRLLRDTAAETGTAILLITHDLGVVAQMARRVLVMYAGQAVEQAPADRLFTAPRHPYTRGLLASMPRLEGPFSLPAGIPGLVPEPGQAPPGCRFAPRCPLAQEACRSQPPPLLEAEPDHLTRCIRHEEVPRYEP